MQTAGAVHVLHESRSPGKSFRCLSGQVCRVLAALEGYWTRRDIATKRIFCSASVVAMGE